MNLREPLALLGGLSPAAFMRDYWQKRPLLIRDALPLVADSGAPLAPVTPAQLFELASRDDVESRLVIQDGAPAKPKSKSKAKSPAPEAWSLKHGPFARRALPPLSQRGWTMLVQAIVLAVIGFVPASVPHTYVTVPISFVAGIQIGLFRSIGDLVYIPLATTGNIMRLVESGYTGFVDRLPAGRAAFDTYGLLTLFFAVGALIGAVATRAMGVQAIWLPAGLLAVTLVLFVVDERRGIEP